MFIKRFLFTAILFIVTVSFAGTSRGTSGVSAGATAFETTGLKNEWTEYWTSHTATAWVTAAANYYGSYSGDASVPGDDDDMSDYYSGGVWDIADAYHYYDGVHGNNVSGSGWARCRIIGTPNGSYNSEDENDNISVTF